MKAQGFIVILHGHKSDNTWLYNGINKPIYGRTISQGSPQFMLDTKTNETTAKNDEYNKITRLILLT